MGYDRMDNRMSISGVSENVKIGNDGVGDGARNQDDRRAAVENVVDTDDRITVVVDLTDGVFANVLIHFFGSLSPQSNLLSSVTAACLDQSHGNKSKFLFISLLTLMQGLIEFLMSKVVIWFALPAPSPYRSSAKRFVTATTKVFSIVYICLLVSNIFV